MRLLETFLCLFSIDRRQDKYVAIECAFYELLYHLVSCQACFKVFSFIIGLELEIFRCNFFCDFLLQDACLAFYGLL
jgi:hypothetical protein